jgi:hypothetical protein
LGRSIRSRRLPVAPFRCTWGARFVPAHIHVAVAEHAPAVRRLRCPYCCGHLVLDNQQEVYVAPAVLTEERQQAREPVRRGRPSRRQ